MSISRVFENLGAPLNNTRWSWGGIKKEVVLRVWKDGRDKINGKQYIWLSTIKVDKSNLGANERLKHVKLIMEKGYKCSMIMCHAKNTDGSIREIEKFNEKEVFIGGNIIEHKNSYWIEEVDRKPYN